MKHLLKCNSEHFRASWAGKKPFEIRNNDRKFRVYDEIVLLEVVTNGLTDESIFTGREIRGFIGYVTDYKQLPGYVTFSYEAYLKTEKEVETK